MKFEDAAWKTDPGPGQKVHNRLYGVNTVNWKDLHRVRLTMELNERQLTRAKYAVMDKYVHDLLVLRGLL